MRRIVWIVFALVMSIGALGVSPAFAQIAEAQRLLNSLSLDAGPADGVAGEKTKVAWRRFLQYRGLPADTPLDAAGLAELRGQTSITPPKAKGLKFDIDGGRMPSRDTYRRDKTDPSMFSITIRGNDYDPVDYRDAQSPYAQTAAINFGKQRGELDTQNFPNDQLYTVDFEMMADNPYTGTIFEFHNIDRESIQVYATKDALRLYAGLELQNQVVLSGDWVGAWHKFRVVFFPASDGKTWFRFYVDGTMQLDTAAINPHFPIKKFWVQFGIYRSTRADTTTIAFRNINLAKGDLGAPSPDKG